ncbi:hydroxyisourate hydrolase [Kushneria aurantia]|uniref:5-hydroxyisourate hydrolase n=1 Tax=Kushneria aurantia TaxID=504092 RepID=A0ABV6G4K7_9GAMM|nr:hydroxyisourate hydrolase [Kushneria aurantia]
MPTLTTHVLDQCHGRPAAGMTVSLVAHGDSEPNLTVQTNADGRLDAPLLNGGGDGGHYRLVFHVRDYFLAAGVESPFLDRVPVEVVLERGQRYHVPLLVTPWAYSVYRGS